MAKAKADSNGHWRNRIVGSDVVAADQLLANPYNWRIHPKHQQEALAASLNGVGWVQEIVVNQRSGHVIDGHLRAALAISRGEMVPVKYVDLSDDEERLVLATLDPLAALAATDRDMLEDILSGLRETELVQDDEALDKLLHEVAAGANVAYGEYAGQPDPGPQIDRAEELREKWQTERGQVWEIPSATVRGRAHRVMCGDSTSAADVARLMQGERAQGCFTSPPYAEQREEQYGGIPSDKYVDWWEAIQENTRQALVPSGSMFVNIKAHVEDGQRSLYVMDLVSAMVRRWKWALIDEFCWLRGGVPKNVQYRFKNAFEPVYHFALDCKGFKFNPKDVMHLSENVPVPRGKGAGNTNWARWQGAASDAQGITGNLFGPDIEAGKAYPSNVIRAFSNKESLGHPAAFAVELAEFFIKAYSDARDGWYEPFGGSGTVAVAAERYGRVSYTMELLPEYLAVMLQRLTDMGLEPYRVGEG